MHVQNHVNSQKNPLEPRASAPTCPRCSTGACGRVTQGYKLLLHPTREAVQRSSRVRLQRLAFHYRERLRRQGLDKRQRLARAPPCVRRLDPPFPPTQIAKEGQFFAL